jgi:hypothetical protein
LDIRCLRHCDSPISIVSVQSVVQILLRFTKVFHVIELAKRIDNLLYVFILRRGNDKVIYMDHYDSQIHAFAFYIDIGVIFKRVKTNLA